MRCPRPQETSATPAAGVAQGNLASTPPGGLPTRRGCPAALLPVELYLVSDILAPAQQHKHECHFTSIKVFYSGTNIPTQEQE